MRRWQWRLTAVVGAMALLSMQRSYAADAAASEPAPPAQTPAPATPEKAAPAPEHAPSPGPHKDWIRGSFDVGVDAGFTRWDSNAVFNQSLQLQVDPPGWDKLHLRGLAWLNEDVDSGVRRDSALHDINDAYRNDFRSNFLYLYADIDDLWGDSVLRVGRQRIQEGLAFNRIDGVYFHQNVGDWEWYVFGGTRASLYRNAFEDPVCGAGAAYRPFTSTRIALDGYYGWEHRREVEQDHGPFDGLLHLSKDVKKDLSDGMVSLSVWQAVTPDLQVFGRYTSQGGNGDDILLNATGDIPCWDLSYEVAYHQQLNSIQDRVSDVSVYYRVLGDYEPFNDIRVMLHKPLYKKLVLSLEAEYHNSFGDKPFTGNRDFEMISGILSDDDVWKGFGGQVALERWFVHSGNGMWTVTGEVTKKWKDLLVAVGTDFERYEDRLVQYNPWMRWLDQLRIALIPGQYETYNPFVIFFDKYVAEQHNDVHSIYARTKWATTKNQDLSLRVTYERDDSPESPYWRVQAGYSLRF